MHHGFMAARSDFAVKFNAMKTSEGVRIIAQFFGEIMAE
jgi:hypothetical protein